MTRRSRHRRQAGMTLIELLIVIAIVAAATGGVALSYRQVQRAQARASATKLAAAIRYTYNQAIVTGKYFRLTFDLSTSSYRAEKSDERFYLSASKESSPGRGLAYDADAETKRLDEAEARDKENSQGMAKQLQPYPMAPRAHFQQFKDAMLPQVSVKGAYVRDIYTPRQREPYTDGKAFLYFFPDGHSEQAYIHIVGGKKPREEDLDRIDKNDLDIYTLIVHPLTGRVELKKGDIDAPRGFDDTSDNGDAEGQ